jgi:hypothetical protein
MAVLQEEMKRETLHLPAQRLLQAVPATAQLRRIKLLLARTESLHHPTQ